jgi:hypothetical protein
MAPSRKKWYSAGKRKTTVFCKEVTHYSQLVETLFIRHSRAYDRGSFTDHPRPVRFARIDPRLTNLEVAQGQWHVLVLNHGLHHPSEVLFDIRAYRA